MDPLDAAIASYESGPDKLRTACSGIPSQVLNRRIGPGEWSIMENAVHLLDSDLASTHRMRRIVAEDCPLLVAYDENAFIDRLPSDRADLNEVRGADDHCLGRRRRGGERQPDGDCPDSAAHSHCLPN